MKALFVGVGSIGKRHIRDFYLECEKMGFYPDITVKRRNISGLGELDGLISRQITSLDDQKYDIAFITNPTTLHYDALKECAGKAEYFFIEKPIFETAKQKYDDLGINEENAYVAAPMRHTKLYREFKEIVQNNRVFSARVICSSYLPGWRQDIDYRTNYSAIREMGGGVQLDLVHELDYIYDLFGYPEESFFYNGKYSNLEITSDDISVYILKYKESLCEVHLDYFGSEYTRKCELYTEKGNYVVDFHEEIIKYPNGREVSYHVIKDEEYINEMKYFLLFISGKAAPINPPERAIKVLRMTTERIYDEK